MTVTFQQPPANLEAITNERSFQALVTDTLRLMGWVVIDVPNMRANHIGTPDLLCFRQGRGEMLELKIRGNRLSAGQRAWQERWLPEGTVVHLVTNTGADWNRVMQIMR